MTSSGSGLGEHTLVALGMVAIGGAGVRSGYAVVPGVGFMIIGSFLLLVLASVALDKPELLGLVVMGPALAVGGWLTYKVVSAVLPILVVGAALLVALWAYGASQGIGRSPWGFAQRRPQLAPVLETLKGRHKEFDTVMLSRGLFTQGGDGSIQRPAVVGGIAGDYVDSVRFRPLPGTAMAWEAAMPELCHLFGQPLTLSAPQPGTFDIEFAHTAPPLPVDPLAVPITQAKPWKAAAWVLRVGVSEDGEWVDVPLANRAGAVVGGQPGSGKTGSLRAMLSGFCGVRDVQLAIVDGKGGSDWEPLAPRCFSYISTIDDLDTVFDFLRSLETERARRVSAMKQLRGSSNFWDSGPGLDLPLIIVAIDECQAFLSKVYHVSKADKDKVDEIIGLLQRLVAQARSAGIFCILATQKPTTDSLPSALRESAGIRVAYSVSTRQAAEAVLGEGWKTDECDVTPIGQPRGVAVCGDGMGQLWRVRSPFVPERELFRWASTYAPAVVDPRRTGRSA